MIEPVASATSDPPPVTLTSRSGRLVAVRPIRPQDAPLLSELYFRLSPETQQLRFFCANQHEQIVQREAQRLAAIDPQTQAALLATISEQGQERAIGVARLAHDAADPAIAEFAIVMRDDFQRDRLGSQLLRLLIEMARARGVRTLRVVWRSENIAVQHLIQRSRLPARSTVHRGETTTLLDLA